ncbi:nucleotidyltransferase domain-containing protein [Paenibacillus jilunlii]|uniref:DNA polymerase III subunit beta n=1 Tax=Paenibacillus jilunlii TaxID=682956 RepID=A0A1G9NE98_9BACL|nr:nucleotidyltransferase domain-containing protein [Paenibacillus jilunlii]KWX79026.1 DNA polymerase III subunit beta [Paenibacillus jilunlii]SDL84856.1 Nucleotidyltransferase domain-containing protein [Paenibacillus jilunlii]
MDEHTKHKLLEKNEQLINMVIERVKRDFPEDIAIIGLSGSFLTGDFHEKSDLDLIIINNTDRGWEISSCFIFDDVGYDIYCTPWNPRIEQQANLESPMVSSLINMKVLYCAKPEDLERLKGYQQKALVELAKPIGEASLARAQAYISMAKQYYAEALLAEEIGAVRYASGNLALELFNAINCLNNTFFQQGTKRYLEELRPLKYLPHNFEQTYLDLVNARSADELRSEAFRLLKNTTVLYDEMQAELVEPPVPTYDNLKGTYEELWSNQRNKVIASTQAKDKSYAFLTALSAQDFLDEMLVSRGTAKFDVMKHFSPDALETFQERFMEMMDEYLDEYKKVGREVARYESIEELTKSFMGGSA